MDPKTIEIANEIALATKKGEHVHFRALMKIDKNPYSLRRRLDFLLKEGIIEEKPHPRDKRKKTFILKDENRLRSMILSYLGRRLGKIVEEVLAGSALFHDVSDLFLASKYTKVFLTQEGDRYRIYQINLKPMEIKEARGDGARLSKFLERAKSFAEAERAIKTFFDTYKKGEMVVEIAPFLPLLKETIIHQPRVEQIKKLERKFGRILGIFLLDKSLDCIVEILTAERPEIKVLGKVKIGEEIEYDPGLLFLRFPSELVEKYGSKKLGAFVWAYLTAHKKAYKEKGAVFVTTINRKNAERIRRMGEVLNKPQNEIIERALALGLKSVWESFLQETKKLGKERLKNSS